MSLLANANIKGRSDYGDVSRRNKTNGVEKIRHLSFQLERALIEVVVGIYGCLFCLFLAFDSCFRVGPNRAAFPWGCTVFLLPVLHLYLDLPCCIIPITSSSVIAAATAAAAAAA